MALAHINGIFVSGTSTSQVFAAYTPASAGNLLIVACRSQVPSTTLTAGQAGPALQISDDKGNVWESGTPQIPNTTSNMVMRIFYCRSCIAGATTVTIACANGGTNNLIGTLDEFSGHNPAGLDQSSFATGSSAAPNSGSKTTTTANQIIFGCISGASTVTAGGTFTVTAASGAFISEWKIVSSTGSYSADGTMTSGAWSAAMVTFSDSAVTPPSISRVNSGGSNRQTSGTTLTLTYMPSGNANLIAISIYASALTGSLTIADSNSNTIVPLDGPASSGSARMSTFYIAACKAGPTTFTATFSTSSFASIMVDEFASPTGFTIDQHATSNPTAGVAGAFTSTPFTTTQANEVIWCAAAAAGNASTSGPYVAGAQDGLGAIGAWQIVSSIQTAQTVPFVDSNGSGGVEMVGLMTFYAGTPAASGMLDDDVGTSFRPLSIDQNITVFQ